MIRLAEFAAIKFFFFANPSTVFQYCQISEFLLSSNQQIKLQKILVKFAT